MLRNIVDIEATTSTDSAQDTTVRKSDRSLQRILWTLWTIAVVAAGAYQWYADSAAGRPVDVLGLIIYSVLTGAIGLVVMTMIEMWFEPQRFVE
jgi:hypothetical protein